VILCGQSVTPVPWENIDLCEYLASHGYVVISAPAMGVKRESTHDVVGTNAQALDISYLIGFARTLSNADVSELAAVGFSWGGLAELFAAARDNRIKALVALDGSMRYYPEVVQAAGDVHPEQMSIPLLYFMAQWSLEDKDRLQATRQTQAPNVLNQWTHGDLITIQMLGFIHPEFVSLGQRNERLWKHEFSRIQEADYDRKDGEIGYAWLARYTREFLDDYLKHQQSAAAFLRNSPADNGVPAHVMGVKFRGATIAPASFGSFVVDIGEHGFDHTIEIYERTQREQPNFKLESDEVVSWAYDLLANSHVSEAVAVMKLGVQLDPSSHNFTSLGEMYAKAGLKKLARESYEKALESDSSNFTARDSLSRLRNAAAPSR
jgi:dienelactone hydrolase